MGSASLRKKRDKYYARFYSKSKQPKRKEVALYTTRKSVAKKKLRRMEEGWADGTFDPWRGGWQKENVTLKEATERFLDDKRKDGLQESTVKAYEYKLGAFEQHVPPGNMVRYITPEQVRTYIHAPKNWDEPKKKHEDVTNATKRSRYRHLRAFFSWAVDKGFADESPIEEVSRPRKEEKKKAFLSPKDVKKILRAVDAHREVREGEPGPTPNDQWLKDMIRVAVGTGLRRGELLNLRWTDIDLEKETLMVRHREGFTAKNGRERVVPLRGDALETLQSMYEERQPTPGDPVFVVEDDEQPKPDRVSKRFKFYVRKAKLEDREDLSFHSCRHTTGSWLSMQGVPMRVISEILGHSNTQVTEIYSHLQPEVMERAMDETFGG